MPANVPKSFHQSNIRDMSQAHRVPFNKQPRFELVTGTSSAHPKPLNRVISGMNQQKQQNDRHDTFLFFVVVGEKMRDEAFQQIDQKMKNRSGKGWMGAATIARTDKSSSRKKSTLFKVLHLSCSAVAQSVERPWCNSTDVGLNQPAASGGWKKL